jgi:hypothetical protein
VFELLSAIYKSHAPIQPQRLSETDRQALTDISSKQPKSAKIEEWKSLPLDTDENRHNWWARRFEVISLPTQSGPTLSNDIITPQEAWVDASPMSVNYDEVQPQTVMQPSVSNMGQTSTFITSWQPSLDMMIPGTSPNFDDCLRTATHTSPPEVADEINVHIPLTTSKEPSASTIPQVLSADRWRKYF